MMQNYSNERNTCEKALIALSLLIPVATTFGRAGIVVEAMQTEREVIINPPAIVAITGFTIAISYWAMFSGYSYGFVNRLLAEKNYRAQNNSEADHSNPPKLYRQVLGGVGFLTGTLLGLSEGALNFLGTRHLILLMGSKNDLVDIIVPCIFGFSSFWCWLAMVAPKAQILFKNPRKIFVHNSEPRGLKFIVNSILGGFTGSISGIGLGGTAAYGIFKVLDLIDEQAEIAVLPKYAKILIAAPFFLGSSLSASTFYMQTNTNLMAMLTDIKSAITNEVSDLGGQVRDKNPLAASIKIGRWLLCTMLIFVGFYATYTLSLVSIRLVLNLFFGGEAKNTIDNVWFDIYTQVSSVCLGFTSTALSGREGCRFVLSKPDPKRNSENSEEEPLIIANNPSKCNLSNFFWFKGFYHNKVEEAIKNSSIINQKT